MLAISSDLNKPNSLLLELKLILPCIAPFMRIPSKSDPIRSDFGDVFRGQVLWLREFGFVQSLLNQAGSIRAYSSDEANHLSFPRASRAPLRPLKEIGIAMS